MKEQKAYAIATPEERRLLFKGIDVMKFIYTYCGANNLETDDSYREMQAPDLRGIAEDIDNKFFICFMYVFDYTFLLAFYHYLISIEDFENCKELMEQVTAHNEMYNDNISLC